jgi:hypothetical protein
MEKEHRRPQVVEAAAGGLHHQIRLPSKLESICARPRWPVHNQDVDHATRNYGVVSGLKAPHQNRGLETTPLPQLPPFDDRTLLRVEVGEQDVHAAVRDRHRKRPSQGRLPDPTFLRHEAHYQWHATVP